MKAKTELFLRKLPERICVGSGIALVAFAAVCAIGWFAGLFAGLVIAALNCDARAQIVLTCWGLLAASVGGYALLTWMGGDANKNRIKELEGELEKRAVDMRGESHGD